MIYKSQNNEYKVIKKLGEGASGITYLVSSQGLEFVLKELKVSNADNWKVIDRFKKEINNLKSLNHSNIPKYVDFIEDKNQISYVQEYIQGDSLEELIKKEVSISPQRLEIYIKQGLEILNYIHTLENPLIHRDISPKNIIVNEDKLYLIDLGVALTYDKNSDTVTTAGTFGYMAPEQIMGQPIPQSDLYSLGMTFVSLINQVSVDELPLLDSGKIDINKSISHLPDNLKHILLSMTQSGATKRLKNANMGLKYLDGKIKNLGFEIEKPSIKNYLKKRYIFLVIMFLVLAFGFFRYNKLVKTNNLRVGVFGSIFNGHPNFISTITKIYFNDYTLISNSSNINFLTTLKNDKYLLSFSTKNIILWDLKTKKIIWNKSGYYSFYSNRIYLDKDEKIFIVSNYKTVKVDLSSGKETKSKLKAKEIENNSNFTLLYNASYNTTKYKNIVERYKNVKKVVDSNKRDYVIIMKKNFSYFYNLKTDKEVCKVRNYSDKGFYSDQGVLSPLNDGGFAISTGKSIIDIYDRNCNKMDQIPRYSWSSSINYTNDAKYLLVGERGGFIYQWKINK